MHSSLSQIFDPGRRSTMIMGVLNVTPDSFSDGGRYLAAEEAIRRGLEMAEEGADLIDVGGESSRPGAQPVPLEEEIRRVLPVVERLAAAGPAISVDTTKAEVARRAVEAGAVLVNDISALRFDPQMATEVARMGVPVVLMHMRGTPQDMQQDPVYADVVGEVKAFLNERIAFAASAGIPSDRVMIDPGIGFGKTVAHNLEILRRLSEFTALGYPVLIGPSRKSFLGKILDLPVEERVEATAAAVAIGVWQGAAVVRVHDVRAIRRVVRVVDAIRGSAVKVDRR